MAVCNFIKVTGSTECTENYSGVGSRFYLFNTCNLSVSDTNDTFTGTISSPNVVYIKSQSGKVTATSNPNGGGFNNVYTCVVNKDMENMSALASAMNNSTGWGIAIPTGKKSGSNDEFIVLYSKDFDIEFSMESDTGDAPDSDHGHTLTITQNNMIYALQKWYGTLTA